MLAIELIEEVGNTLGKHIAGLINLFNPELVIIGGVIALTGDYYYCQLKVQLRSTLSILLAKILLSNCQNLVIKPV